MCRRKTRMRGCYCSGGAFGCRSRGVGCARLGSPTFNSKRRSTTHALATQLRLYVRAHDRQIQFVLFKRLRGFARLLRRRTQAGETKLQNEGNLVELTGRVEIRLRSLRRRGQIRFKTATEWQLTVKRRGREGNARCIRSGESPAGLRTGGGHGGERERKRRTMEGGLVVGGGLQNGQFHSTHVD